MTTKAQDFVHEELERLLDGETPYRAGALVLTYASEKPGVTCQVALGAGMARGDFEHALDFVQLVKSLRRLADELEARIAGKTPITQEIVDDGRG